ncbi:MAG: hypothetical protein WCV55_02225 [Candidatus Paceibacterota bacterium]
METPNFNNPEFLDKKYPDLAGSKPVARAVEKSREQGESPHTRAERVDAYLDRLEKVFNAQNEKGEDRGFELLKYKILDEYVTKPEEIPESYWKLQENIMRERGQLGDYQNASEEQKSEMKRQNSEGVLSDQKSSLEQWLDYFHSSDSAYITRELKYWIFRNITKLQEFDKERKEFTKRSKGTVKQFPDINHEALGYVIDAVIKKYEGKPLEWEHDIQLAERQAFEQHLAKEDFAKLYSWANELMNPIPEHLLPITDGEWRKFDQDTDPHELVKTIRGKGTGWCTAGEQTAKTQLSGGDFYVFYSLDDEQKPTIPRIAIRMESGKIAEVRGVAYKQNLDPYMGEVLEKKLEEFPDKEEYLKKEKDMSRLTEIEKKTNNNELLSKSELEFLYEINSPIEGFGYQKDPRIKELQSKRNPKEDAPVVFECKPEEIAWSENEITKDTKAYVGPLFEGIFQKGIEHIYTSFPEGKLEKYHIEIGGKTKEELEQALKTKDAQGNNIYYVNDWAKQLLDSKDFEVLKSTEQADLIRITVKGLGFPNGATTDEVYAKAEKLGLELCPPEVGPQLRLATSSPDWMLIAMKQITDRDGSPRVFYLIRRDAKLVLNASYAESSSRWSGSRRFVFFSRKNES